MRFKELRLANLRNIETALLELAPGANVFTGPNGAGKTSILEGAYLLSHVRSFRGAQSEFLLRRGSAELSVFGLLENARGSVRLGLSRTGARWSARIDNETPQGLVALLRECAVVCFEPGSHSLISGPSEERRSYLDWGVFHVEPRYPEWSRRYRRALQQRNALLKTDPDPAELASWTQELVAAAEPIAIARAAYFSALQPKLRILSAELIPELGDPIFRCRQGWDEGMPLGTAVERSLDLDRLRKYTARGPHRADWSIQFQHAPAREQLSRGQEKLCAIVCMLAQAQLFRDARGEWPIVLLDDLASELDIAHQNAVLRMLLAQDAQVLMTGTEIPAGLRDTPAPIRRFHVEQGQVQPLV